MTVIVCSRQAYVRHRMLKASVCLSLFAVCVLGLLAVIYCIVCSSHFLYVLLPWDHVLCYIATGNKHWHLATTGTDNQILRYSVIYISPKCLRNRQPNPALFRLLYIPQMTEEQTTKSCVIPSFIYPPNVWGTDNQILCYSVFYIPSKCQRNRQPNPALFHLLNIPQMSEELATHLCVIPLFIYTPNPALFSHLYISQILRYLYIPPNPVFLSFIYLPNPALFRYLYITHIQCYSIIYIFPKSSIIPSFICPQILHYAVIFISPKSCVIPSFINPLNSALFRHLYIPQILRYSIIYISPQILGYSVIYISPKSCDITSFIHPPYPALFYHLCIPQIQR